MGKGSMDCKPADILIVDDHADSAVVLSKLLSRAREGCHITVSDSFHGAIEAAQKKHFDLLLCDIGLPDGDGCDLLQQVRAMYPLPAIAITAYAMASDIHRYREAGFDDHVISHTRWM